LILGGLGCSGVPVRVRPYDPSAGIEQAGAVYFLPKSRIEVAFTVKLDAAIDDTKCESIVSECKYHFGVPEIADVTIGTQPLPDPKAGFVIETNGTFVTGTDFTGIFSSRGELTEVTAFSQDHALEFVSEGIGVLSKLAGLVVMAGPTQAATLQAQFKRRRALLTLLAKSDAALTEIKPCIGTRQAAPPPTPAAPSPAKAKTADTKPPPNPKAAPPPPPPPPPSGPPPLLCASTEDLKKAIELRKAVLKELKELNQELSVSQEVRINCAFEPPKRLGSVDIRKDGGVCPAYTALKLQLAQTGFDVPLPTLTVQWASANSPDKPVSEKASAEPTALPRADNATFPGIVYRIPEWFTVTVTRNTRGEAAAASDITSLSGDVVAISGDVVAVAGDVIALPQFGKLVTTSFNDKDLRAGRELRVELHQGQGSLKRLSFKATPIDPNKIRQAVEGIPTPKPSPPSPPPVDEITRIHNETKRILAEKAYIEALKELDELKRQRASEGQTPSGEPPPSPPGPSEGVRTDHLTLPR
jgi:hypothetical protein